ncbi:uncharacterized protein CTRU02_211285 [Colletotrichum truncatum]|uniref:Uncharacterized protein n=1 Tax=Colletotrichum truncatum TaxID=5467 RepID=A0ACC3YRC3_COLTU|nr:uncharacterized protein CTRU02_02060 [Colletotrichum truncatum]KAF6799189.1 hypothetical protein CTRU02_02060 [Colletotrichum truncatum]
MASSGITGTGARASSMAGMWIRDEADWSGISDPKARRKIQNRHNQRVLRLRRRKGIECRKTVAPNGAQLVASSLSSAQQGHMDLDMKIIADAIRSVNILAIDSEHNRMVMRDFEAFARRCYAASAPAITFRPSLSQFNFIRALWANVEVLGLSSRQMSDDDALSPFNSLEFKQADEPASLESRLPAGLRPTNLQHSTLHHPWIDLLPIPEMRDNLFRRGLDSFDEEKLCHDMRGQVHQDPGVLVWRDPWDPTGWEITEPFVRSWGWTIVGCWDLFRSTNRWRALRGEKPLFRVPSVRK